MPRATLARGAPRTSVPRRMSNQVAPLYPTLSHALAALDAFPIAGSLWISPDDPGVDFDALERARAYLPQIWRDDVPLSRATITPQGGIYLRWQRPMWELEVVIDPFSLVDFRAAMPDGLFDWTRADPVITLRDTRAILAMMAGERARTARAS